MSKHQFTQRLLLAVAIAAAFATPLASHADQAAAIWSVKDPAHYGPHPAAADNAAAPASSAGGFAGVRAVKDPANYGPHSAPAATTSPSPDASFAAFESVGAHQPAPRPGSWEAIRQAKDPSYFSRRAAADRR